MSDTANQKTPTIDSCNTTRDTCPGSDGYDAVRAAKGVSGIVGHVLLLVYSHAQGGILCSTLRVKD